MRMLDNVIDLNYYAVKKARDANLRHRPVGLGVMAFQDCLYALRIPYASEEAVEFATAPWRQSATTPTGRQRSWHASATVPSFRARCGIKVCSRKDTLDRPAQERGGFVEVNRSATMDWDALRKKIARDGMRNSNCVAIAPTATISNIVGVDASIEPNFGNLSVKSNLSGEFTVTNAYLCAISSDSDCGTRSWVMDLKHFDGSLASIDPGCPQTSSDVTQRHLKSIPSGSSRLQRVDRSGSTRRSHSISTLLAHRARSSMRPTNALLAARTKDHPLLAYPIGPC